MSVTAGEIRRAIQKADLTQQVLCIHSSLSSFGHLEDGAATILQALLAEECTLLVPTFSYAAFAIAPPADPAMRPLRNGLDYDHSSTIYLGAGPEVYTQETQEIDMTMGAFPRAIVESPGRIRGAHALNSFAAIGPLAHELIAGQSSSDVYAPLRVLTKMRGTILLMGVGLERMTFLHYAEQEAGRTLFRRWANGPDHRPLMVAVGGCSEGFERLAPWLAAYERQALVGQSLWRIFPARETLQAATQAIQSYPRITHCDDAQCLHCADAIQGGPLLTPGA